MEAVIFEEQPKINSDNYIDQPPVAIPLYGFHYAHNSNGDEENQAYLFVGYECGQRYTIAPPYRTQGVPDG